VARHFWQRPLGYFGFGGTGKQVRDVLHVDDLFDLVNHQLQHLEQVNGCTLNAGGGRGTSVSLQELTALCQRITGHTVPISSVAENRQADIALYLTDNARVTGLTGWQPRRPVEQIVEDVYRWLRDNEAQLKPILA
jgi:CDP-paratose 2-epimerase